MIEFDIDGLSSALVDTSYRGCISSGYALLNGNGGELGHSRNGKCFHYEDGHFIAYVNGVGLND